MKKNAIYIIILLLLAVNIEIKAQRDTEFWFVVPEIDAEHSDRPIRFVFTTTDFPADITIEMPANGAFTPINLSLAANTTDWREYSLAADLNMFENKTVMNQIGMGGDNISNKGLRITSTAPITCYYEVNTTNNSDIWSLKGSNGLGKDFYIPFQDIGQNRHKNHTERGWSSIEIIGTGGTTVIQIVPGNAVYRDGNHQNETNPYTITLEQGEVYTLPPAWDPTIQHGTFTGWFGVYRDQHIGGTHIHVQSGDDIAIVVKDDSVTEDIDDQPANPQPTTGFGGGWDIIADQWVPEHILGTEYIAMRGDLNSNQEFVFVVATEDDTRIWWTSTSVDTSSAAVNATIDEGDQVRIPFPKPEAYKYIISNNKLSVLHVSGTGTEMGGAVLPPIDKCTGSTTVGFTRSRPEAFHMNIMVRTTAKNSFLINGAAPTFFNAASFTDIPNTNWSVARIQNITTADVPVELTTTISNTKDVFHLGIINETNGGAGCRFGYFSDFNEVKVSALSLQGGEQPSATPRACIGDSIQLFASGGTTYEWWPSENLSDTTISNPKILVTGYKVYYVKVSGFCNQSDTASVSISPLTQPEASFMLESPSGCSPLDIQIRNLSTNVSRMYWDFNSTLINGDYDQDTTIFKKVSGNDSIVSALDTTINHIFNNTSFEPTDSAQIFEVKLKVKTSKCYDSLSTTITIYPEVTADFTLSDLNDTLSCNPAVVDFAATVLSVNEDFYKWDFGDGGLSAAGDTTHEYNNIHTDQDTTYTARLVVRSDWFCRDTAYQDFTIHPYLEGGFTIDKDQACSPFDVRITNISSGADSIFLDYGDGKIDTLLSFSQIIHRYENNDGLDEVDTNIIVMRVKNDEGCEFTDRDTIIVYPEFEAIYTIDGNNYTGCNSRTVTFTNTTKNGTHLASRYLWEFDDGTSMDTTNNTINKFYNNTTTDDKTYNFRLTARSIYGCTDDTTNSLDIYRAYADFTVDNNEGCSPLEVKVTNVSVGNQITNWDWDYGNGHTDNVKNPFPYTYVNTSAATDNNELILKVTGTAGCSTSDTIDIIVYPQIKATYTIVETAVSSCDSLVVDFNTDIIHSGLKPTTSYTWNFGDGASASIEDPTHVYKNLASALAIDRKVELHVETDKSCYFDTSSFIKVYPFVNANISIDKITGCSPLTVDAIAAEYIGISTYNWTYGDGYNPNVSNPTAHTYPANPPGANDVYTLKLDVSDLSGTCTDSDTETITVYDEALADFNPKNSTDCDPYTVTFDNLSVNTISYKWDFSDGGTTSTDFEPTYEFVNPTSGTKIFNVELEATSDEGCTNTFTSTVNVLPVIEADFDINISEGCSPLTITISNNYVGTQCYWYWDKDDNVVNTAADDSTVNFASFTKTYYNNSGTTRTDSLTLIVGNGNGCYEIFKRAITIHSSLDAQFNFTQPNACNPSDVTFTSTTSYASNYKWNFGDGSSVETPSNPVYKTFVNNTASDWNFTVNLTAKSAEGCTSTTSDIVTVHSLVNADFDINVSEGCSPLAVTISNNSSGTEYYWFWDDSDLTLTNANSNSANPTPHTYTFTTGGTRTDSLTLIVDNGNGCYDTLKRAVKINSSIDAQFNYTQPNACNPSDVTFTSTTLYSNNYKWNFGDGSSVETTSNPVYKTFVNNTANDYPFTVNLTAESAEGCTSTKSDVVTVHSLVNADFDINTSEGCSPLPVTITNNSSGTEYYWFWDDSDLTLANANSNLANPTPHTYTYTTGGTRTDSLTLIVGNGNGCYDTLKRAININSSIVANFTYTQPDSCTTSDVAFNSSTTYPAASKYSWNFGDGSNTTTTSSTINKQFTNNTTNDNPFYVTLSVETAEGCTDTDSKNVTVYSKVIADYSIPIKADCPPFENAVIENTSIGNNSNTYQWFVDGNVTPDYSSTGLSNFVRTYDNSNHLANRNYEIRLLATNPRGCTSEYIDTITVYEYVEASFSMDLVNGCSPLDVDFEDLSLVPTSTKYTWNFGDGASSGLSDPKHTFYNSSRTDDLTRRIDLAVQSQNYCSDDTFLTVEIFHQPLANFYIDKTSSCPPLVSTLVSNSEGEDMFEWRFDDGNPNNTTDKNLTYSWPNTDIDIIQSYNLELWVGTDNNCTDSTSLDLSVFPFVVADFTIDNNAGCSPLEDVNFTNASTSPATQFFWSFGDGSTTNLEDPKHDFANITSIDRVYDVFLQASSEYNCKDTITKQVTVFVQPDAEFYVDPTLLTFPNNIVGIANRSNSGPFDYYWEFGNIDLTTSVVKEPVSFEYEHWGEKIIELSVTSQTNTSCFDYYSDTIIILPPLVNAAFTTNIDGGCANDGLEVEFTAQASAYAEDYSYEWDFGDGETGTGQYITHTFEETGAYYVKMTAKSNEVEGSEDYEYKTIRVYANPEALFEVMPTLAMLDPVNLTARVKFFNLSECNDTSGCSYLWDFGDNETAISRDVTHYYSPDPDNDFDDLGDGENGIEYDIKLVTTTAHGCKDSLTLERAVKIIGAGTIAFPNAFNPNSPNMHNMTFKPVSDGVIKYELLMYNRWGELIFTTKDLSVGWDGKIKGEYAKPDVYVWKASGSFTNGRAFELVGDVTLIR